MQRKRPRRELNWDDVRLFLALYRSHTVGSAARILGVDGSTVSRRLCALENALAASLFERGRSGVTPTEGAEELMPVAEQIEDAMLRFASSAETLEREVAGRVRITCPADIAEVIVVPLLSELLGEHPALGIDLDAGETLTDLTRREADLALRTVRPERGDLIVTRLLAVTWVLAAAPKLARRLGALRDWEEAPWVGWGDRLAETPPARWRARHVRRDAAVRSDSLRTQLAAVANGLGVALLPARSVEPYGLVPVKIGAALRASAADWPSDELYLVTHRALRNVPRVRVVWDLLLARLRDRPANFDGDTFT